MRQRKKKIPKGYDSKLEYDLHKNEFKSFLYHPEERIDYETRHTYQPDFSFQREGKEFLVEVKGRFRDRSEATKYIFIRESLKENQEIIFVFQDKNTAMPFAKRRKDGTKQTVGEWAEKNGFRYGCYKRGLPEWITSTS